MRVLLYFPRPLSCVRPSARIICVCLVLLRRLAPQPDCLWRSRAHQQLHVEMSNSASTQVISSTSAPSSPSLHTSTSTS